jgi:sulfoxide reductase heme-binding subunit YedZ
MVSVGERNPAGPAPPGSVSWPHDRADQPPEPQVAPRTRATTIALWSIRVLLLTPFVLMGPEILSGILGRPDAVEHLGTSTADVLGTSSFVLFVLMLTVTPIYTVTGWTWHVPLRRDIGVAMFLTAALDLVLAALTTGEDFSGGVLGRLGGHSFLLVGTLATLLLVPLALTAHKRAQRWLGGYWKRLHRLVYVIWALILLHLFLLFDFHGIFLQAVALSVPLVVLRIPAVRSWWINARRDRRHRILRGGLALVMVGVFAAGYVPIIRELADKGGQAIVERPVDD